MGETRYIKVRVNSKAKKEFLKKEKPDHFLISVREPAKRNLANIRVREILADYFKLPVSEVRIINGHHSDSKLIVLDYQESEEAEK